MAALLPPLAGTGQLAQLDGQLVQVLSQRRDIHEMTPTPDRQVSCGANHASVIALCRE
jgi:hypothetical protein